MKSVSKEAIDYFKLLSGLLFIITLLFFSAAHASKLSDENFAESLNTLNVKSFKAKQKAIESFSVLEDDRVLPVLKALSKASLFYRKSDKTIVYAVKKENLYEISNVVSGESYGEVKKKKIKKIRINNKLRRVIRAAIANLSLASKDVSVRVNALNEIIKQIDDDSVELLRTRRETEKDKSALQLIDIGLSLYDIDNTEKAQRLKAIELLSDTVNPEARKKLSALIVKENDQYAEEDKDIRLAAEKALKKINDNVELIGLVETTFFGLSLGSVLVLSAIGLAITFGVMGVINMAHGELMMIGAYTTYVVQLLMPNHIDMSLLVAVPSAFVVAGLFGIAIERGVIRHLYGRPLETLLATFGISLVLQQMVRSIFSPLNRSVETPSWMSGSLEINSVLSLTYNRLYIIVFALLVFAALLMIMKKTSLGLQVRAVSQNRPMAKAMGIKTEWVDALTFGLGSGIAGVAGVALSQLTNVGPNLGQTYIIDSFMVVVFGGVGNLWGTLVAGLSLGVANKVLEPWSGAVLAKILVLVFIILFIQKKPRGLFPQKGRSAEN